jgi:hypothetical protein
VRWSRLSLCVALAVAAFAAVSCGGGGGGGSPTSPPPQQSSVVFTPSGGSGGSGIVLASGPGSQGTTLVLNVQTTGIQDLYGVAFHLTYPSNLMHLTSAAEGNVLNAGGTVQTLFEEVESPPGTIVVGLTRSGVVSGTSTGGTLLTLRFTAVASGTGALAFSANAANNSTGSAISGLTWTGGSVQVTIVPGSS